MGFEADKNAPDPKALSCYDLLRGDSGRMLLRFVDGRPVSQVTEDFLAWVWRRLGREGKRALLLIWDNASWHVSRRVRRWVKQPNGAAQQQGRVRILPCYLPSKSPWLNAIEPQWAHGKKALAEPDRKLDAQEIQHRATAYYHSKLYHLLKQKVA